MTFLMPPCSEGKERREERSAASRAWRKNPSLLTKLLAKRRAGCGGGDCDCGLLFRRDCGLLFRLRLQQRQRLRRLRLRGLRLSRRRLRLRLRLQGVRLRLRGLQLRSQESSKSLIRLLEAPVSASAGVSLLESTSRLSALQSGGLSSPWLSSILPSCLASSPWLSSILPSCLASSPWCSVLTTLASLVCTLLSSEAEEE